MSSYTGDRIRQYRKERGLTQKQLGDICGMVDSAIRRYESGRQKPKIETLQKIADALCVPVTQLLDIEEGQDINIVTPDLDELRKEYQDLCYSLTEEELQIMVKIAYAFIKLHGHKDNE